MGLLVGAAHFEGHVSEGWQFTDWRFLGTVAFILGLVLYGFLYARYAAFRRTSGEPPRDYEEALLWGIQDAAREAQESQERRSTRVRRSPEQYIRKQPPAP